MSPEGKLYKFTPEDRSHALGEYLFKHSERIARLDKNVTIDVEDQIDLGYVALYKALLQVPKYSWQFDLIPRLYLRHKDFISFSHPSDVDISDIKRAVKSSFMLCTRIEPLNTHINPQYVNWEETVIKPKEAEVLILYFGLEDGNRRSLRAVNREREIVGDSKVNISTGLGKLRANLVSMGFIDIEPEERSPEEVNQILADLIRKFYRNPYIEEELPALLSDRSPGTQNFLNNLSARSGRELKNIDYLTGYQINKHTSLQLIDRLTFEDYLLSLPELELKEPIRGGSNEPNLGYVSTRDSINYILTDGDFIGISDNKRSFMIENASYIATSHSYTWRTTHELFIKGYAKNARKIMKEAGIDIPINFGVRPSK